MTLVLAILLALSLIANGWLWYRWHSYRARPAGGHSHTGMMPRVDRDQILRDREQRKDDPQ